MTLNNTNTMPSVALSGGTTNLAGPSLTAANISGAAVVRINSGSVSALTHSGGITTVGSAATVSSATISGGQVTLGNTNAMASLAVSGGTVNTVAGATVSNLSVSRRQLSATSPFTVTGTLSLPGSFSATLSGAPSLTISGANLGNSTQASTLTLSGGVLTLAKGQSVQDGHAINVGVALNAQGETYTGTGPSPDTGTYWNAPALTASGVALQNSNSAASGVTFTGGNGGSFAVTATNSNVLSAYETSPPNPFVFGGLSTTPGQGYNVYAIMDSNAPGRATKFTIGSMSQTVTTGTNWATYSMTSSQVYCEFAGVAASASGQISIATASPPGANTT